LPADGPHERLRLLLISDIHVAGPDMRPSRFARIVEQANALRPDAVLIAGDLVGDKKCQIRLPVMGALSYMSPYGDRYSYGVVVEGGKTLVVESGARDQPAPAPL